MAFPQDLLEQANHLARREGRRPKQASLRRAVSAAYYAIFHLLTSEAARNWRPERHRSAVARVFEHGRLRQACDRHRSLMANRFSTSKDPVSSHLLTVIDAFLHLQQERNRADYDNSFVWSRGMVLVTIKTAERAFESWHTIRDHDAAQDFLLSFLVKDR